MTLSKTKVRRAAARGLSVGLSATTTLWLAGSSLLFMVPVAHASNDAVVADITSANPRIAPNGESELAVLGVNIIMDANTGAQDKRLQSFVAQFKSDDGADEAALSNIETVRLYSDSGLSGTGGVFDSNDALIDTVTRGRATDADGDGDTINTTLVAQTALAAVFADSFGHGIAAPTTTICLDNAAAAGLAVGDAITFLDASAATTFNRIVTVVAPVVNAAAAASACVAAGGVVATHTLVTVDTAMAGVAEAAADSTDTVTELANYPAGITALVLTSEAAATANDFVKVGTGLTAEILTLEASPAGTIWTIDGIPGGGLTGTAYAHANLDAVVEVADQVPVNTSGGEGFTDYAGANLRTGYEMGVVFGDTVAAGGDAAILPYTPPTTDTGNDAGNDLFLTVLTAGGVANQSLIASIFPDEAGDLTGAQLKLNDIGTDSRNMLVGSNTSGNETKTVTFGSDGVAPSIQHVWTYDNDGDGNNDRVRIHFSESMANTVTSSENFKSAIAGNVSSIESTPASVDEIDLAANGTWQTTTMLNDTIQIDFGGDTQSANCAADVETTYCNATASTGDTYTAVYDADGGNDLADATGQLLLDQSVATTDMARPVILATSEVRDTDGDSHIDQLRAVLSETMSASSTHSGLTLRNITNVPSTVYTLSGVSGLATSTGVVADGAGNAATANTNDMVLVAVTETAGNDVANNYTLDYTAASTLTDTAGNEARSLTGLALAAGSNPFVQSAYFLDLDNVAAGAAALAGDNDADGQLDALFVIFNQNIDFEEDGAGLLATTEMTLSGGYAFQAAAPLDPNTDGDGFITTGMVMVFPIGQSGVVDTDITPDWTYNDDGSGDGETICAAGDADGDCADSTALLGSIVSSTVVEQNLAGPRIVSATLYESTADDIWQVGETMSVVFSEPLDTSTLRTSWVNDALLTGPSDFVWGTVTAAEMPDSGTVSVSGRVVTFSASVSANAALAAADTLQAQTNEIYDQQGVSAPNTVADSSTVITNNTMNDQVAATLLTVTPAAAPAVLRIQTNDENGNGVLDSFIVEFGGLVTPASLVLTDWAAARGSNFNVNSNGQAAPCGGVAFNACSTNNVSPDLTLTGAATLNGGNDSRIIVRFTEVAENTGMYPQLKYVQGSLADPAGNKISTFNAAASDQTKFDTLIGDGANEFATRDRVAPKVLYKLLRDRDMDGKIDQAILVYSETILNGAATIANGVLTSLGWTVAGKSLAANGVTSNNTDFQAITFATVSNIYSVDVTEGASGDTTTPSVSYVSSGQVLDAGGNVLANVAAGGEVSDVANIAPPTTVMDGDLVKGSGPAVYIVKMGSTFKRHVLSDQMGVWYPHLSPFWSKVKTITDAELNAMTLSAWVRVAGTAAVYEVNDDRTAHHLTCNDDAVAGQDCANEWIAAGGNPAGIYDINSAEWGYLIPSNPVVLPDQLN